MSIDAKFKLIRKKTETNTSLVIIIIIYKFLYIFNLSWWCRHNHEKVCYSYIYGKLKNYEQGTTFEITKLTCTTEGRAGDPLLLVVPLVGSYSLVV